MINIKRFKNFVFENLSESEIDIQLSRNKELEQNLDSLSSEKVIEILHKLMDISENPDSILENNSFRYQNRRTNEARKVDMKLSKINLVQKFMDIGFNAKVSKFLDSLVQSNIMDVVRPGQNSLSQSLAEVAERLAQYIGEYLPTKVDGSAASAHEFMKKF